MKSVKGKVIRFDNHQVILYNGKTMLRCKFAGGGDCKGKDNLKLGECIEVEWERSMQEKGLYWITRIIYHQVDLLGNLNATNHDLEPMHDAELVASNVNQILPFLYEMAKPYLKDTSSLPFTLDPISLLSVFVWKIEDPVTFSSSNGNGNGKLERQRIFLADSLTTSPIVLCLWGSNVAFAQDWKEKGQTKLHIYNALPRIMLNDQSMPFTITCGPKTLFRVVVKNVLDVDLTDLFFCDSEWSYLPPCKDGDPCTSTKFPTVPYDDTFTLRIENVQLTNVNAINGIPNKYRLCFQAKWYSFDYSTGFTFIPPTMLERIAKMTATGKTCLFTIYLVDYKDPEPVIAKFEIKP